MDNFFGIILVVLFLLIVMRPVLQRWFGPMLQRWAIGKMEDRMRRMAGMPTRKEERKARRQARRREEQGAERFRQAAAGRRSQNGSPGAREVLQDYAEDVEYVEVKNYSADIEIATDPATGERKVKVEEQVEDAVYEEIKVSGRK